MAGGSSKITKLVVLWTLLMPVSLCAEEKTHWFYYLDAGLQGGVAYYAGELSQYAFASSAETYGAQVRFKLNPRWAFQAKAQNQRVSNRLPEDNVWGLEPISYQCSWWHVDVVGEYNFFELGLNEYNIHMRAFTPYIFVGLGASVPGKTWGLGDQALRVDCMDSVSLYLPVGLGIKWKFAERWQLQLSWQHNIYVSNGDVLEGDFGVLGDEYKGLFNNTHEMNGHNIMNNDVASTLTLGVVFEFGRKGRKCVYCEYDN